MRTPTALCDVGERSTETDESGGYVLSNLSTLTRHVVAQVPQEGWIHTLPTAANGGVWAVTLRAAESREDVSFGARSVSAVGGIGGDGTITGFVFQDTDGKGIPDTTVYLDLNDNGRRDGNEPKGVTDSEGKYPFEHLVHRTYDVRVDLSQNPDLQQITPKGNSFSNEAINPLVDIPSLVVAAELNGNRVWT